MKVREKNDVDAARIDADPMKVRQQRRAAVEQDAVVDRNRSVVTLGGESRSAAEEGEPQAIVTAELRYTS